MKYNPLLLLVLFVISCTQPRKMPLTEQETDHSQIDNEELWRQSDRHIQVGGYAPIIQLPKLFPGDKTNLDSLQRKEHILLFWASWCDDCQREMPGLLAIQQKYPEIPWISISFDNEAQKAQNYIQEHDLNGTHLFDARNWRGPASEDYAVPLHGIPYIIYVGENGKIRWYGGTALELEESLDNRTYPSDETMH